MTIQIVYLVITILMLGVTAAKHGQPKKADTYNIGGHCWQPLSAWQCFIMAGSLTPYCDTLIKTKPGLKQSRALSVNNNLQSWNNTVLNSN